MSLEVAWALLGPYLGACLELSKTCFHLPSILALLLPITLIVAHSSSPCLLFLPGSNTNAVLFDREQLGVQTVRSDEISVI